MSTVALVVGITRGTAYIANVLLHEAYWLKADLGGGISLIDGLLSATQFAALIFEMRQAVPFLYAKHPWPSEEHWLQSIAVVAPPATDTDVLVSTAVAKSVASAQARMAAKAARRQRAIFWCRLAFMYAWFMFAVSSIKIKYHHHVNWSTIFCEVAMIYYLHLMLSGLVASWDLAADHHRLSQAVAGGTTPVQSPVAVPLLHEAAHYVSSTGREAIAPLPTLPWGGLDASDPFGAAASKQLVSDLLVAQEGLRAFIEANRAAIAAELEVRAREHARRALLELLCLLLNTVAFLGFLTCVIGFIFVDETIARTLPFYPPSDLAIHYGCLVGIVAWTCEPVLHLLAPPIFARAKQADRAQLGEAAEAGAPARQEPLRAGASKPKTSRRLRAASSPRAKRKSE